MSDAQTPNLKPCPFCGGQPTLNKTYHEYDEGEYFNYRCRSCGSQSRMKYARETCPLFYEEVRSLWNARARPDLPEGVGELKQWLLGLAKHYEDRHNFNRRNVARKSAEALEALGADNARLREGLGLIETEISSEETYNPNIAKIVRIARQEHEE